MVFDGAELVVVHKTLSIGTEKKAAIIVTERASSFSDRVISTGEINITKVVINQPDRIVPVASRFRAPVRFVFSSLVGDRGEKEE